MCYLIHDAQKRKDKTKAYQINLKTGYSKETLRFERQDNSKSVG